MSRRIRGPLPPWDVPMGDGGLDAGLNLLSVLPSLGDLSYQGVTGTQNPQSTPKPPGGLWGQTQGADRCCRHKDELAQPKALGSPLSRSFAEASRKTP